MGGQWKRQADAKAPAGTRINWGHPLARGLVAYAPLNEQASQIRDLVRNYTGSAISTIAWTASPGGMGLRDPSNSDTGGNIFLMQSPLSGLVDATFISWVYLLSSWTGSQEVLGFGRWDEGFTYVINRKSNSTQSRCIIAMSTTSPDLTVTDGMTTTGRHCVAWVLKASVLSCYINGVAVGGTSTGSGTIVSHASGLGLFTANGPAGSMLNLSSAVGLAAGIYNRALSVHELEALTASPYAVLQAERPRSQFFEIVGRTTKNTRSAPLGIEVGMNWRGH